MLASSLAKVRGLIGNFAHFSPGLGYDVQALCSKCS